MSVSFIIEALLISRLALDLVGATVLSHAHNAEDAIATHARLLSEKRVGFLILAFGLALYLAGLVLGTSESLVGMAIFAAGVLLGLGATALWIKVGTKRLVRHTHEAARNGRHRSLQPVRYVPEAAK